jgi:hypothetical protein
MSCRRELWYSTSPASDVPEVLDGSRVLWQRDVKVVVVRSAQSAVIELVIAASITFHAVRLLRLRRK